jgi:glutamine synthetase
LFVGIYIRKRDAADAKSDRALCIAASQEYTNADAPLLPSNLQEATNVFAASKVVQKHFGDTVQKHYVNFGKQSVAAASTKVTDYERQILLMDI